MSHRGTKQPSSEFDVHSAQDGTTTQQAPANEGKGTNRTDESGDSGSDDVRSTKKRRLERAPPALASFMVEGQGVESMWPTTCDPTVFDSDDVMKFIETKDGTWVFGDVDRPRTAAHHDVGSERMIRPKEYQRVWKDLETSRRIAGLKLHGFLLTGHPGIGKSHLLDVLLAASLHKYPDVPVLAITSGTTQLFTNCPKDGPKRYTVVVPDGQSGLFASELSRSWSLQEGSPLLVLHDIKHGTYRGALVDSLAKRFSATCVLASSPKQSHYHEFLKSCGGLTYFLPVLSKKEARAFVDHFASHNSALFEKQFADVGGVPRHLVLDGECLTSELDRQDHAAASVPFEPLSDSPEEIRHNILMPVVSACRRKIVACDFVSHRAFRCWRERQTHSHHQANENARQMGDPETTHSVIGIVASVPHIQSVVNGEGEWSSQRSDCTSTG